MTRQEAIATPGMWAGVTYMEPHTTSGWHHHGDHQTVIFVVGGRVRMESGPGGSDVVEAGPGDVLFVPRGAIHREDNPDDTQNEIVVVRCGQGTTVVNVDGPAP